MTRRSRTQRAQSLTPVTVSAFSTTAAILPQRIVPLLAILTLELFVVVGLGTTLLLGLPGWYGAVSGFGVALIFVLPIRGGTIPTRFTDWLGFWWERRSRADTTQRSEPFDVELKGEPPIGLHWDGRVLVSLIRIQDNPHAFTVMDPGGTVSGETVSLRKLSDCLRQFDITLDSIDVISQGARSRGHGQIAATYNAVLGPLPAIAVRSVWVAVRLDPTLCPDAVRHRGEGWEGMVRTAAVATKRVANRLSDMGLRAELMTAREIDLATDELSDGVGLTNLEETWSVCRRGRFQLRSFALKPSMFTTAFLNRLWAVSSYSTTMCVSMRRDMKAETIMLRGLVRFGTHGRKGISLRGLAELRGRQYAALLCSLPLPAPRRHVKQWVYGRGAEVAKDLAVPAYGCGQLVGADEHGRAVALPLFGPRVGHVEICGTLHLAQQVVLRSLALGARVRVHTGRLVDWQAMVEQVGDETFLQVANNGRGQTGDYSVEMFDGVAEHPVRSDVTTMVVKPSHAMRSEGADASLHLIDHDHDVVRVETSAGSAVVTMVATDDEMRYLKSSLNITE